MADSIQLAEGWNMLIFIININSIINSLLIIINKNYLLIKTVKICFDIFTNVSSRVSAAVPRPVLLDFAAGSDVFIVVKHKI